MKWLRLLTLLAALYPTVVAPQPAPRPLQIRVALPDEPLYNDAIATMRERLPGGVSVDRVPFAAAGEVIGAVRTGALDVAIVPGSALGAAVPQFGIYDLPFAFSSTNAVWAFSRDAGRRPLAEALQRQGLVAFGVWYGGAVVVASNVPIRSPRDFKGIKLIVRSPRSQEQLASVGAAPLRVPAPEIVQALERGAADAAEVQWAEIARLAPNARYVVETNHRYVTYVAIANRARMMALPSSVRERLGDAIEAAGERVSEAVRSREERTRLELVAPGRSTAMLAFNDRMRFEWRESLSPAQARDRETIGRELVDMASRSFHTASMNGTERAIAYRWNAWFRNAPGTPPQALTVGNKYTFALDLGRAEYPGALTGAISRAVGAAMTLDPAQPEVTLLIKPALMGGVLKSDEAVIPARRLALQRTRMQAHAGRDALLAQLAAGAITLEQLAAELSVAVQRVSWEFTVREAGCARVALSIWDALGLRPLDYIVVTMPAATAGEAPPQCRRELAGGELSAGLQGYLEVDPANASRKVDAALHLFDSTAGGADAATTVVVYLDRAEFTAAEAEGRAAGLYAWELDSDFASFLDNDAKLPKSIANARAAFATEAKPYRDAVRHLGAALFGGRTPQDEATSAAARASMQRLGQRTDAPVVLTRYFSASGAMNYVPLAILAADAPDRVLDRRVTVVQPLLTTRAAKPATCFSALDFAIPRQLDGVTGNDAELLRQTDWRIAGNGIAYFEDNLALLRFLEAGNPGPKGEALVLLAHHGRGELTYSSSARPDRIISEEVKRRFAPGSVAVLAACSTTGVSKENREFARHLAGRGIEAFVVSPFQVDGRFGTRLAVNFAVAAHAARAANETPRLYDLFDLAVRKTIETFQSTAGYKDMALEFQIIGDHELRLCPR